MNANGSLASYIASKGYDSFDRLGVGRGVWVNVPIKTSSATTSASMPIVNPTDSVMIINDNLSYIADNISIFPAPLGNTSSATFRPTYRPSQAVPPNTVRISKITGPTYSVSNEYSDRIFQSSRLCISGLCSGFFVGENANVKNSRIDFTVTGSINSAVTFSNITLNVEFSYPRIYPGTSDDSQLPIAVGMSSRVMQNGNMIGVVAGDSSSYIIDNTSSFTVDTPPTPGVAR